MTTTLKTAADLMAEALPFGPAVEGADLVFAAEPPAELAEALAVAHTGVRALLTGRPWLGCGSDTRTAAPRVLNPKAPIPAAVMLLAVAGDSRWDRIGPAARADHPDLFGR